MKTTQIALEADKVYNNFKFTKEAIEHAFVPNKQIPITMMFESNNIVGWGTMISCDDGKLKVEMELSPSGESLIKNNWILRVGGVTRSRTNHRVTVFTDFQIDIFALVPPEREEIFAGVANEVDAQA